MVVLMVGRDGCLAFGWWMGWDGMAAAYHLMPGVGGEGREREQKQGGDVSRSRVVVMVMQRTGSETGGL